MGELGERGRQYKVSQKIKKNYMVFGGTPSVLKYRIF
jgi:hypothetical protein